MHCYFVRRTSTSHTARCRSIISSARPSIHLYSPLGPDLPPSIYAALVLLLGAYDSRRGGTAQAQSITRPTILVRSSLPDTRSALLSRALTELTLTVAPGGIAGQAGRAELGGHPAVSRAAAVIGLFFILFCLSWDFFCYVSMPLYLSNTRSLFVSTTHKHKPLPDSNCSRRVLVNFPFVRSAFRVFTSSGNGRDYRPSALTRPNIHSCLAPWYFGVNVKENQW